MLLRLTLRRFSLGARFDPAKDYYKTLAVASTADKDQIRRAYIAMVKRYHPDKGAHNDTKIKEINEANEVLSDEALRREYDQARTFGQTGGGAGSFQQAYKQTGEYSNPFGTRQQRKAAKGAQFYRDSQGNTYYQQSWQGVNPRERSHQSSQEFDAFYEEFKQHFRAMNEQMRRQSPRDDQGSRREGWNSAADQANKNWSKAEYDYQEIQRQKEERARADFMRQLTVLGEAWQVFRSSASQKGFWGGAWDAYQYYRSAKIGR